MEQYKQEFIEFMVESQVLKFGEFTLKSGRKSPFFAGRHGKRRRLRREGLRHGRGFRLRNAHRRQNGTLIYGG